MSKIVKIGNILIGGGNPVSIQSMTNTDTRNVKETVNQLKSLEEAGVDIVRLAVLDMEAAQAIKEIKKQTKLPLIADIHFDYRLALESMKSGIDALRLNPGNIKDKDKVKEVIKEAKQRDLTIRVGVNGGSLDRAIYKEVNAQNMVKSASEHIKLMEDLNFTNIKVSLKASDIKTTIEANTLFREKFDYPIHLGVTEAGTLRSSLIKSTSALSYLLMQGIGDTIRYSITGDPVEEVMAGKMLLKFLGLRKEPTVEIISCPTCGRCQVNVEEVASFIEKHVQNIKKNITIAIMGCVVNGPGEAKHADFGVAGSADGNFIYFEKDNEPIKVSKENIISFITKKIEEF
ncbi:4-hydroxy-3-methylbut-2-en-1-yl diphosphate synthase [Brachyspira pilosicoli WesB]|uniref:4-hydroxy-3-methylbut-2-en-1-yl diphosphate synthase (flavodoxin) n=3 Tax=Brachyspira pilosicoli TaxID=52584 RepID=A0A3B6VN31_BRAPL|nr:flavodoxin-dependent (E)-4-hydroxy-3-methylbut-2-enyl-diphosphate synthase [Brachyspira pilosicoli]AFR69657.1 4-hydroxy-3-methylbut-2-en-1-yl diphosphate synthase [Brachyspira pilosicoli B2904]AGA67148.1 4-hydroxy-3-methylbut-2-en-1-yl diphosphate synthase [Brachyspira pilosicoli P43/6/78]MBW5378575.1 flavodoxin-dependent (E)-4-hydroxy-3-methylbut-2-enyl-diphosphate synthase [Brachyspira pilosicoli]MBW5400084.1 flavodoxin-dependent (E)-4-hydroxy-3-methylbut-2-enyl-diphosphate synthase [Brach